MNKEETTYAAIFKDGKFVEKATLKEVVKLEKAYFYLRIDFHHKHTTSYGNTYYFYWFKIIDSNGEYCHFSYNNYDVIEIGFERGSYIDNGMIFKIFDKRTEDVIDFSTKGSGLKVFETEVFPFMKKLDELGSWESYKLYEKSLEDQKKIEELKIRIEKMEKIIGDYERHNNKFKIVLMELFKDNIELLRDDLVGLVCNDK